VSLPELMIALAIVAVLGAAAVPSFKNMSYTIRARSVSSELYASLSRARSEAIKRNAEVSLLPLSQTAGAWQDGWKIPDPAGALLETHAAVQNTTVSGPASVVFLANGRVKGGGTPRFDISVNGSGQHRCITVDLGGRPNQKSEACPQ
jgi:type IV fimbrial biogenesis protein FimT